MRGDPDRDGMQMPLLIAVVLAVALVATVVAVLVL